MDLTEINACDGPTAREIGHQEMYEEVRRARAFDRPLAVVALSLVADQERLLVSRFIQEVQHATVDKLAAGRLAKLIRRETHGAGVIAADRGKLVLLLPESDHRRADRLLQRVKVAAQNELGVKLRTGAATFPDEEVTLAGLLERAERQLAEGDSEHYSQLAPGAPDVQFEQLLDRTQAPVVKPR